MPRVRPLHTSVIDILSLHLAAGVNCGVGRSMNETKYRQPLEDGDTLMHDSKMSCYGNL